MVQVGDLARSKELARLRAAIARAQLQVQRYPMDEGLRATLLAERAAYAEAKIADCVARVVAKAPPLSAAQRDRLAILLRPMESTQ